MGTLVDKATKWNEISFFFRVKLCDTKLIFNDQIYSIQVNLPVNVGIFL